MLFREIIAVCSKNYMEPHINGVGRIHNYNVEAAGMCSYTVFQRVKDDEVTGKY
jgi:hypothetical protein